MQRREIYRSSSSGTIDLKSFEHWMRLSLDTESGKFVSFLLFFVIINANGSCNRLCNCFVAFCIVNNVWTDCVGMFLIQVFLWGGLFVCLIYELESAIKFKLVNGLSRGLDLSIFVVVDNQMFFPVYSAIYSHYIS